MTSHHPEPIVLSREEHINEIMRHWRGKQIDDTAADILFDEQLRQVAFAMAEPQPVMKLPKLTVWVLNVLLWAPLVILGFEIFRP